MRNLGRTILMSIAAVFLATACAPATAQDLQPAWRQRAAMVEVRAGHYGEKPAELGVTSDGAVLELFTSDDGATWTLVVTLPNGMSRAIAAGEDWMGRSRAARGEPM